MDERLRVLGRRFTQSGTVEDHAELIHEQVRQGVVPLRKAVLAAHLGHEAARLALNPPGWIIMSKLMEGHDEETRRLIALILLCTHTHPRDIPEDWHQGHVDYQTHATSNWVQVRWGLDWDLFGIPGLCPQTAFQEISDHCRVNYRRKRFELLLAQALAPWLLGGELGSARPEYITAQEVRGWMGFAHWFEVARLVDAGLLDSVRAQERSPSGPAFKRIQVKELHAIVVRLASTLGRPQTETLGVLCDAMEEQRQRRPRRFYGTAHQNKIVGDVADKYRDLTLRYPQGVRVSSQAADSLAYSIQAYLRRHKEDK